VKAFIKENLDQDVVERSTVVRPDLSSCPSIFAWFMTMALPCCTMSVDSKSQGGAARDPGLAWGLLVSSVTPEGVVAIAQRCPRFLARLCGQRVARGARRACNPERSHHLAGAISQRRHS